MNHDAPHSTPTADRQHAKLAVRVGRRTKLTLKVNVSSTGLLSIGALVSMTLLSTAVIVRAARAQGNRTGKIGEISKNFVDET